MVQSLSLHGAKAQILALIQNPNEKETATQYNPDSKFLSQIKENSIRPPIHEDFNSFLASSTSQIQEKFLEATKVTATMQNHRFGPENPYSQTKNDSPQLKTIHEIKLEPTLHTSQNNQISLTDTPKLLELMSAAPVVQAAKYTMDKGYGPRTTTDPLITLACATDVEQISMGLVCAVHERSQHQQDKSDTHKFNESHLKTIKPSIKEDSASRSEHAQLLKREEIEVLRDVKEKFQQQLNAQHPCITVPLKHPEGIVDIHMRFDRKVTESDNAKGSVRIMFSGSNPEIVTLFAQHREEFMNIITKAGYAIDPSRMQFKGPSLTKSI